MSESTVHAHRSRAAATSWRVRGGELRLEPAPMLIGFVLGPMMEEHLRRAMLLSRGDVMVFVQRPISATMLAIGAIALIAMLLPNIRKGKDKALQE